VAEPLEEREDKLVGNLDMGKNVGVVKQGEEKDIGQERMVVVHKDEVEWQQEDWGRFGG